MNVIVADDDKVLSKLVCTVLNEAGHITLPAYDSMQTMMFVMKQVPDLVVLDINMPGGTGLDVLRRLKNSTKTKGVPIIVITGSSVASHEEEARALGAKDFLSKPIDPDALIKAVAAAIR